MADLRSVFVAAPIVATIVVAWGLLEDPVAWSAFVACGLLALVPCVAPTTPSRVGASVAVSLVALAVAFGTWPHEALGDAWTALHDAPAVRAPFDPAAYPSLHGLVAIAAFALALGGSLATTHRRTPIVVLVVALGVGFPARLLDDANAVAIGAVALASVLWVSIASNLRDRRRMAPGIALGAVVLSAAVAAAATGVAPGEARVDWRGWDPFAGSGRTASLRYLWDSHYGGIEFPARPTVVLRVRAPKRAEYWRVSTLETFAADRWIENLYPVDIGAPRRRLPPDPLVPNRDAKPGQWLRQTVTVEGLEDDRVAAASQPARVDGESLGRALVSRRRGDARRQDHPARGGVHRLELRAATDAARACGLQAALPRRDGPLPRARASPIPRVRRLAARACRRPRVPRREVPAALAVSARSGRRLADARLARARRTRRRCCSSGGSGARVASGTTSALRQASAIRRSSTSSR